MVSSNFGRLLKQTFVPPTAVVDMFEAGQVGLVNGTNRAWIRIKQDQYQMVPLTFPDRIEPGSIVSTPVKFIQTIGVHRGDTQGNCSYVLDGTDSRFHIKLRDEPSRIEVQLENIETPNNPNGNTINLGWQEDGIKYFILSGQPGNFSSSNPPTDWMQRNLHTIGSHPLAQVCMPGTHDAGMGEITWADNIPSDIISFFTQTQSRTILGQLYCGSRYFDIRPEISQGGIWTGHYEGKMGARGQSLAKIIDDINTFTAENRELIILNLSHAKNTDDEFREYNQADWDRTMEDLLRLNHRFIYTGELSDDISLLRLDEYIGGDKGAAVLCVVEAPPQISLGKYDREGFYLPRQLNVFNEYSNTDDNVRMVTDQIAKLEKHAPGGDKRLFLLSWTLTQQKPEGDMGKMMAQVSQFKSIRTLAYSANKSLYVDLFPRVNRSAYPNIVYIDFMEDTDCVALAMAINHKWLD